MVCAGQDPKNDMEITERGERKEGEGGGGLSTVGEGEEGLGVVPDDHHPLAVKFVTVGGKYEALELDAKRAIDMGNILTLKIHERGEGAVNPGRHGFSPKVGMEERIMDFLKRYAGGMIISSSSSSR